MPQTFAEEIEVNGPVRRLEPHSHGEKEKTVDHVDRSQRRHENVDDAVFSILPKECRDRYSVT